MPAAAPLVPLAWYGGSWAYSDPDPPAAEPPKPRAPQRKLVETAAFGSALPPGEGHGVILGRFLPPHAGHQYLVDFARQIAGKLTLFMRAGEDDPIPAELRQRWLTELFPHAKVVAPASAPPMEGDFGAWSKLWARLVRSKAKKPDYLFASEPYGPDFAAAIGARYVPVDPQRNVVPISGAEIRSNPWAAAQYLPPCVRAYYAQRVAIIGPESTGKTTLAARLAEHFHTVAVEEYARTHALTRPLAWTPEDVPVVARGQLAAEEAQARRAQRLLFCDTDVFSLWLWSERLFKNAPDWLRSAAAQPRAALHLVLEPDVPFFGEPAFDLPAERRAFFDRCVQELTARKWPFARINGNWDERLVQAIVAVERML